MTATYAGVTVTLTMQEQREINAGLSELRIGAAVERVIARRVALARLDAAREVLEARAEA